MPSAQTPHYLQAVTRPALAAAATRRPGHGNFSVVVSPLAATGPDSVALESAVGGVRRKIAFYAATPAYRPMLDIHGLGHLQPVLHELARAGRWEEMTRHIDDHVLELFAAVGSPGAIGAAVRRRFGGLADRATIYELDRLGRLKLDGRYLTEPGPLAALAAGFSIG